MGTSFNSNQSLGIIPRAARHLFEEITRHKNFAKLKEQPEPSFEIFVQFIEVQFYKKY